MRRQRRAPLQATGTCLAVFLWMILNVLPGAESATAAPYSSQAPVPAPVDWASSCSSTALGLDQDVVQYAPVLTTDTLPGGGPIVPRPLSNGTWVPVIMVHGWTSQDTNNAARTGAFSHLIDLSEDPTFKPDVSRSLIAQLQRIPGAAVFTFDYHPYSARWVDDSHLGPALGKVIDCLYKASGQKVVIVAHSMGGLIARYAATQPGPTGADRSGEISSVVTFGTPETGSVAALLLATGIDAGSAGAGAPSAYVQDVLAVIRLILSACGQQATANIKPGTLCDDLPAPIRAFASDAGIALRTGSPELAALPPWPRSIRVTALAGNATFDLPAPGWFSLPWQSTSVDVGDLIVTPDSAQAGATATGNAACRYQLDPVSGAADQILWRVGLEAKSEVAQEPLAAFSGACFHTDLMRGIEFTNRAEAAVSQDIGSRLAQALAAAAAQLSHLTPGMRDTLVAISGGYEAAAWDQKGNVTFWKLVGPSQTWTRVGVSTYPVVRGEPPSTAFTGALLDGMSDATFIADGFFSGDGTGNDIAFTNGARGWGTIAPGPGNTLVATGNGSTDNRTPGNSYVEFFRDGDLVTSEPGTLPFGPNGEEWQIERAYKWSARAFGQISSTQFTAAAAQPLPATASPLPGGRCSSSLSATYKDFYVSASTTFTRSPELVNVPSSVVLHVQADSPAGGCTFTVAPNFPIVISAATPSGTTWITAPAWVLTYGVNGSQDIADLLPGIRFPGQYGLNSIYFQDPEFSPYYVPKSLGIMRIGQFASPVLSVHNGQLVALTVLNGG
jgi:pimeloyl-ACP methyl ester carboxylesterase